MVDIGLGGFHDKGSVRSERKLIRFPNVTDGRLADAITLLTAPGTERELRSEAQFRRLYRASSLSWPLPRTRRSRLSVLVGVASVASVFATATGLSAASVLPSSASHVVNSVIAPLNADGGSPTTPPPSATQPSGTTTPPTVPNGAATSLAVGSGVTATTLAGTNAACRHGRASCTLHHTHSVQVGGVKVATGTKQVAGSKPGPTRTTVAATAPTGPPPTSTTSTTGGSTGGGTGGSTGGSGGNRGGNVGAGSGNGGTGRKHGGHHGDRTGSGATTGGSNGAGSRRGRHHSGSQTDNTSPPPTTMTSTTPDVQGA